MNELSLLQALLFVKVFATSTTVAFISPATSGRIYLEKSKLPHPLFGVPIRRIPSVLHWSKISEFGVDTKSLCLIDTYAEDSYSNSISSYSSIKYDLTSPREWLEYCETQSLDYGMNSGIGIGSDSAGAGAYTVIRCDFHLDKKSWEIWGKDFHFNRLQESYRSLLLLNQHEQEELTQHHHHKLDEKLLVQQVQSALDSNTKIMNLLLDEASKTIIDCNEIIRDDDEEEDTTFIVVMLTLLWEPDHVQTTGSDDRSSTIRVRGHAFSTLKKVSQLQLNEVGTTNSVVINPNPPVQAVIGYLTPTTTTTRNQHNTSSSIVSLPNRHQNFPQAKLSCWCRRRRLLEEIFKNDDNIGDVILTKHHSDEESSTNQTASSLPSIPIPTVSTTSTSIDSVELLEGLTSNIFVVYPGKILRTPPSTDVLGGYARQLILDCAVKCGYQVEIGSIPLMDSSLWKEVFLTSSIRLIVPVHKLLLPSSSSSSSSSNNDIVDGNNKRPLQLEIFWEIEHAVTDELTNSIDDNRYIYVYDELYEQVMKPNQTMIIHNT
jgi:hypothetical protein